MSKAKPFRIAATADLHYSKGSRGQHQQLFSEASHSADVLLLCGDLTDYGLPEEAHVLAEDIRTYATIPVLAVLGNHDFESGQAPEVRAIVEQVGVKVLDGESVEVGNVGFAGVCGFGGGFDGHMLNAWGEPLIKAFVQESVDHALRLEKALARLQTKNRVVLLHYSPLRETVMGENLEVLPFLGSSRLEGPLNRLAVNVAFHGHAHNGAPQSKTSGHVPVFNVSLPVLARSQPDHPWFRIFELPQ